MKDTWVAKGLCIDGGLTGTGELVVQGRIMGPVRGDLRVVVERGALVDGDVRADEIVNAGTIRGDILGAKRVDIAASGEVFGNVSSPRIHVADGAKLQGTVSMES